MNNLSTFIKQFDSGRDTYSIALDLHDETFEKYRDMFSHCFGVSVNPGWYSIVDEMLGNIKNISSETNFIKILQIKEKFGDLRVYRETHGSDEYAELVEQIINTASTLADSTCVICSSPGRKSTKNGWHNVFCERHK